MVENKFISEKDIKNEYDLYQFNKIDEGLRKLRQKGKISIKLQTKILREVIIEINSGGKNDKRI